MKIAMIYWVISLANERGFQLRRCYLLLLSRAKNKKGNICFILLGNYFTTFRNQDDPISVFLTTLKTPCGHITPEHARTQRSGSLGKFLPTGPSWGKFNNSEANVIWQVSYELRVTNLKVTIVWAADQAILSCLFSTNFIEEPLSGKVEEQAIAQHNAK